MLQKQTRLTPLDTSGIQVLKIFQVFNNLVVTKKPGSFGLASVRKPFKLKRSKHR